MHGFKAYNAAALLVAAFITVGGAWAQVGGISEKPPLSCTTESQAFTIDAIVGSNDEFPVIGPCGDKTCSFYGYRVRPTTINIDHAVISASATQKFIPAFSSSTATAAVPGAGDGATGFLVNAVHEYPIRLNSQSFKGGTFTIATEGASSARVGTVLIRSGTKRTEKCLIAAPGATGSQTADVFQPIFVTKRLKVAGGKCTVDLIYKNDLLDEVLLVTDPDNDPGCQVTQPEEVLVLETNPDNPSEKIAVPLRNNISERGITFGNGTTTCYGPPVPSIPRCICTRAPCP